MKKFCIALCQLLPEFNTTASVNKAILLIEKAAENGANMVALPEMFYYPYDIKMISKIVGKEEFYLVQFSEIAKKYGLYLLTGSMAVQKENKIFNMSHLIGPDGNILGSYSKCHLFDVNLKNVSINESSVFTAGNSITPICTELCNMGIMICYDIRFPEFARLYSIQGTELLIVPAVFNSYTGAAHWHTFMKTRAIENQIYLAAISQAKHPDASYSAYGHSLVVSPWGEILCEAMENEEIVYCTIDPDVLYSTRQRLPLLSHRRTDIYDLS